MDDRRARELLAGERARVEQALGGLGPSDRDDHPDPVDPGDGASTTLEDELEEGMAERLRDELEAIERAERRLAEGTYGRSVDSGEQIPDGRLEVIPWAERTADEQSRYDAGGR
jgi:RNA polymerase-binding transcription factor